MSNKIMKHAFQRHPRPQLPTAAALLERSKKSEEKAQGQKQKSPAATSIRRGRLEGELTPLGILVQRQQEWTINVYNEQVVMVKSMKESLGLQAIEKIKLLDHPNVVKLKDAFLHESRVHLVLPYARFTLEDLLSVHMLFDEPQVQLVATSIFAAVKHVSAAGIVHNAISIATVRVCERSGHVQLVDFDDAVWLKTELSSNIDLEHLGFALLECMNSQPSKSLRDAHLVRQQRECGKMFGLNDSGRWSGAKSLVDFLDELLNDDKPAISKFNRPHHYVAAPPTTRVIAPFIDLARIECFTVWRPTVAM